jgi:hypothetical protein
MSRFTTNPPDKAIELISNEDLTNRIMEMLHHLLAYQQLPFSAHQHRHPFNSPTLNVQMNEANHLSFPSSDPLIQHQFIHQQTQPLSTPPVKCYFCGNAGHRQRECREQARVARKMFNANEERGRLMTYYNYGALGHQPSSCSNKEPITCGVAEGYMEITV